MNLASDYLNFWLIVAGLTILFIIVVATIIALPLYGIWYEKKRDNDYMDKISDIPFDDENIEKRLDNDVR